MGTMDMEQTPDRLREAVKAVDETPQPCNHGMTITHFVDGAPVTTFYPCKCVEDFRAALRAALAQPVPAAPQQDTGYLLIRRFPAYGKNVPPTGPYILHSDILAEASLPAPAAPLDERVAALPDDPRSRWHHEPSGHWRCVPVTAAVEVAAGQDPTVCWCGRSPDHHLSPHYALEQPAPAAPLDRERLARALRDHDCQSGPYGAPCSGLCADAVSDVYNRTPTSGAT